MLEDKVEFNRYLLTLGPYFFGWLLMQSASIGIHNRRFVMFRVGSPLVDVFAYPNVVYAAIFFAYCVAVMWLQSKWEI